MTKAPWAYKDRIKAAVAKWEIPVATKQPGMTGVVRLSQTSVVSLVDVIMPVIEEIMKERTT